MVKTGFAYYAGIVVLIVLMLGSGAYSVRGSHPDWSVTQDFTTAVQPSDNDIGKLIFTRNPQIPDAVEISDYGHYEAQQADLLTWQGNGTIAIGKDGVFEYPSTGSQYAFIATGIYDYWLLSNTSMNGTVTVSSQNMSTISITVDSPSIAVNASQTSFVLNNDEQTVDFNAYVGEDLPPAQYPINITITDAWKSINISLTLNLSQITSWEHDLSEFNTTIKIESGGFIQAGAVKVTNLGNTNFDMTAEFIGNGAVFMSTQTTQKIYKKTSTFFNILARIPMKQQVRYNLYSERGSG